MTMHIPEDGSRLLQACLGRVREHEKTAQWEKASKDLIEALGLVERHQLADIERAQVLTGMGGVERRLGRFAKAEMNLKEALQTLKVNSVGEVENDLLRIEAMGELGIVYEHQSEHAKARDTCLQQYMEALELIETAHRKGGDDIKHEQLILRAEATACRAIGNAGRATHQLAQQMERDAVAQLEKRVQRARSLQERLAKVDPESVLYEELQPRAVQWESIGYDRLTLCHAALGNTAAAVSFGSKSQAIAKTSRDPTVRALSRFFSGYALLRDGQKDKAMDLFNSSEEKCTCAIALCKEPSEEYRQYLQIIVDEGVDLNRYDEQGYSALDYAMYNEHTGMQDVITNGLRKEMSPAAITELQLAATLKKHYREIFQEHLRPELSRGGEDCIENVRRRYAEVLIKDETKRSLFDSLNMVAYSDFLDCGRLPAFTDQKTQSFDRIKHLQAHDVAAKPFVVFLSYRWRPTENEEARTGPDDSLQTQYSRMCSAIEALIQQRSEIEKENVYIWVDFACIDQENKDPGIAALPVVVAQCDAMISVVESGYFGRAWCAVEAYMVHTLIKSYGRHEWYHYTPDPGPNAVTGSLASSSPMDEPDIAKLRLTYEADRQQVEFLLRQSRLLGIEP
ncbi:hypothetical protein JX265_004837 [Neoarthrinium moseri]|uniref:Heterokaryon incompatibility domain-containing protein n=1 Tax=Neoarthrinium moseri TaxID=1658444 RepID=A0A9Q0ASJ6_9PEZI|nr:hypothetical protein JX265_004837 [Neoarthrinium moseri]